MSGTQFTTEFQQEFAAETSALIRRRFLWFTGVMFVLYLFFSSITVLSAAIGHFMGGIGGPTPPTAQVDAASNAASGGSSNVAIGPAFRDGPPIQIRFNSDEKKHPPAATPAPTPNAAMAADASEDSAAQSGKTQSTPPRGRKARAAAPAVDPVGHVLSPSFILITLLSIANFGGAFAYAWRRKPPTPTLVSLSMAVVLADGLVNIAMRWSAPSLAFPLFGITLTHLMACCFMPWNPKQALLAIIPTIALNAVAGLVQDKSSIVSQLLMTVMFVITLPLPGTLICYLRQTRRLRNFRVRFIESRYGELRKELTDARRIHEALFPRPHSRGDFRLEYRYLPMRSIGGDYLYARHEPASNPDGSGPVSVLLLDVTGHGIPAALTVNRLYGEFERLFAENPSIQPGHLIASLNRYVFLTLADHSLYVTAVAVRFDPGAGTVQYASAGHPPAFLRTSEGRIEQVDSTTFLLGAVEPDDFDPAEITLPFRLGDTLLLYTDGAMETKNELGRNLGVEGLLRATAARKEPRPTPGTWPDYLLDIVERYRSGPITDDTLIVELSRSGPLTPADHADALAADHAAARGATRSGSRTGRAASAQASTRS